VVVRVVLLRAVLVLIPLRVVQAARVVQRAYKAEVDLVVLAQHQPVGALAAAAEVHRAKVRLVVRVRQVQEHLRGL